MCFLHCWSAASNLSFTTWQTGFLISVFQEAFAAFHPNPAFVQKFLKPLQIGELAATEPSQDRNKNVRLISASSKQNSHYSCSSFSVTAQRHHRQSCVCTIDFRGFCLLWELSSKSVNCRGRGSHYVSVSLSSLCSSQAAIIQDFHTLRAQAEREGLFQARPLFFCLHMGHIVLLEVLAWLMLWHWGTNWILTLLCAVMLATAQVTPAPSPWCQKCYWRCLVLWQTNLKMLLYLCL